MYKLQLVAFVLFLGLSQGAYTQDSESTFSSRAAAVEKTIYVEGLSSDQIYKKVSRWLVAHFDNPEECIKARIEGEYVKGVDMKRELIRKGMPSSVDLQYTFRFEINSSKLKIRLTNFLLIYSSYQDIGDQSYLLEDILKGARSGKSKKKDQETESILWAIDDFSNQFLQSVERFILQAPVEL